jgi:hypothetical protein
MTEKLYSVTLGFRDGLRSTHKRIASNLDQAIREATESEGRKPVWASGQCLTKAEND